MKATLLANYLVWFNRPARSRFESILNLRTQSSKKAGSPDGNPVTPKSTTTTKEAVRQ